jgi:hypothetical protein
VIDRHHQPTTQSSPLTLRNVTALTDFGSTDPLHLNAPTRASRSIRYGYNTGTSRRGAPPSIRRPDANARYYHDENVHHRHPYETRLDAGERAELARYRQTVGTWP